MSEPNHSSQEVLSSLKLTPREGEVLFWISQGKSNHDIGVIVGASTGTIRKHVEHILGKLNVENRTAAAVVALQMARSVSAQTTRGTLSQAWALMSGLVATQFSAAWSSCCELCATLAPLAA